MTFNGLLYVAGTPADADGAGAAFMQYPDQCRLLEHNSFPPFPYSVSEPQNTGVIIVC